MIHHPSRFLGIPFLALLAGCVINPVTGQSQLSLISQSDEIALGTQQMQQWIQANEGLFPDSRLQAYTRAVGARIARVSQRPQLPYEFYVINSSEMNASTLPGGKTLINRGLVAKLSNEDQFAALIAHEVGHTAAMHISTQITQQSFAQLLLGGLQWGLSKGGVTGSDYYLQGAGFGAQLALLKFSRAMEQQADDLAMDYLIRAGYNPEGLLQLMRVLQAGEREGPALAFLQSHPLPEQRIRDIVARLNQIPEEFRLRPYGIGAFQGGTQALFAAKEAFRWEQSAKSAAQRRDFANAILDFKRAIQIFGSYAPFHAHLAFVQLKSGRFYEAQATARRAQQLGPDLFLAQSVAGLVHFAAGDYTYALEALRAADRLVEGIGTIRFYMAETYFKLQDVRRAIALYRQIAQSSPDSAEGQASLLRLQQLGAIR